MTPPRPLDRETLGALVAELTRLEELQAEKVIALARRLHPGVTSDDIKNPHDFPELSDPDWHYEDGQLSAYQTVLALLRALLQENESHAR